MTNSKKNWERFGNNLQSNKYECFYCGDRLSDWNRTVDHIVPKSKGGILSNDNKAYCCKRCNQFKADMDVVGLRGMVKFLLDELNREHEDRVSYYSRVISRLDILLKQKNDKSKKGAEPSA
tara:strand:- start:190 stop:552 length:363 start_codon:yes stop_codon:yes gene_type:complete